MKGKKCVFIIIQVAILRILFWSKIDFFCYSARKSRRRVKDVCIAVTVPFLFLRDTFCCYTVSLPCAFTLKIGTIQYCPMTEISWKSGISYCCCCYEESLCCFGVEKNRCQWLIIQRQTDRQQMSNNGKQGFKKNEEFFFSPFTG
jgi:hypothetical protein